MSAINNTTAKRLAKKNAFLMDEQNQNEESTLSSRLLRKRRGTTKLDSMYTYENN